MKNYLVSFYVELPDDAPIGEIEQFMKFELGQRSFCNKLESSLQKCSLDDFDVGGVTVEPA